MKFTSRATLALVAATFTCGLCTGQPNPTAPPTPAPTDKPCEDLYLGSCKDDYFTKRPGDPHSFNSAAEACAVAVVKAICEKSCGVCQPAGTPQTQAPSTGGGGSKGQTASSKGDPHFRTWSGEKYDFHGGCDLVLLKHDEFDDGVGIQINIRTKIETWWSYIERAVIKIGNETLEVQGGALPKDSILSNYWLNGEPGKKLPGTGKTDLTLGGYAITYKEISPIRRVFGIRVQNRSIGNQAVINIEVMKDWVAVDVHTVQPQMFMGTVGLMGLYPSGKRVGRDGTIIEDTDEFGKHWQVLSTEDMLFHDVGNTVQHPMECAMPDTPGASAKKRRRLGEVLISQDDAATACAKITNEDDFDHCVYDVLATNDVEMAGAY